jgi:hypothetical protein
MVDISPHHLVHISLYITILWKSSYEKFRNFSGTRIGVFLPRDLFWKSFAFPIPKHVRYLVEKRSLEGPSIVL